MDNTTFALPCPSAFALSSGDADKLICLGSGNAALLYIYALRSGSGFSVVQAALALRKTEVEIRSAAELLCSAGLFGDPGKKAPLSLPYEETPEYTASDITTRSTEDPGFKLIIEETQSILGHTLSGQDLKILFGLYDRLSLPTEVIFLLLNHCTEEARARLGPSARVSMRAIEKEGYYWFNHEIITLERVEEYLQMRKNRKTDMAQLKRVLQISGRDYTESEYRYVESWLNMGFSVEAIALAYDKTVLKTGKLTWKYADSILQSWHKKGLLSLEEIESGDTRPPMPKGNQRPVTLKAPASSVPDDSELLRQLLNKNNKNRPKN